MSLLIADFYPGENFNSTHLSSCRVLTSLFALGHFISLFALGHFISQDALNLSGLDTGNFSPVFVYNLNIKSDINTNLHVIKTEGIFP